MEKRSDPGPAICHRQKRASMSSALVSCIVPVYNGARYLREALYSIFAQSYRPIEVIVADDGSTDATVGVVASYGAAVRCVTQATAGPPAARNLGLRAARGEFVAFLDADDLWHPEKLARQMARFAARPSLGVSVTHIKNFWIPELAEEEELFRNDPRTGALPGYVTMTLLARRTLFDAVGPFDESLWHTDAGDWFLRAAERGTFIEMLADVLVYHRMHHTNLSRRHGAGSREEFVRLVKRSLDKRRKDGQPARPFDAFSDAEEGD
jgi:glycosyltransferase involved in cell wall biosynthesis